MKIAALGLAAALAVLAGPPANARSHPASVRFQRCTVGKTALIERCGSVTVFENRATRTGRTLAIHVIEIDAAHRTGRAIFWNPGGPGAADADAVAGIARGLYARELLALHDTYDLVFVDNRGTGSSHPLNCDLYSPRYPERYFAQLFPSRALRSCRAELTRTSDLGAYTTDATVDDLDDVRAALGYAKIVLDGGSYGTMLYLDYARRHPARVESIVLSGVAPPGFLFIPLEDAQGAQSAMDDLIADCERDATCHRTFPRFAAHFAALVRRFDRGPLPVRVRNAVTGRTQTVALSKEVFADQLRHLLYDNDGAKYVPYVIERAARNDDVPLAKLIELGTFGFSDGLAMGLNLSVTCAEDVPFISEDRIARTSAHSFQGDTRVRAQQAACRTWNVARAPASFARPVRSNAPILMISGASDPATPPQYGRAALPYLPNARQIVIPHATHDSESPCTDALIVAFVRARSAATLDAARCTSTAVRPPFATSLAGFGS